jgi:hypothetical protein
MPIDGWLHSPTAVHSGVRKLGNNLPSFCLYPVSSVASDHTPLTPEQIVHVKLGGDGKKESFFLHAMGLVAMQRMTTSADAFRHHPRFGEDFENIAMNWAWKDVVAGCKKMAEWRGVKWHNVRWRDCPVVLLSRRTARGPIMGVMAMPN